MGGYGDGGQGGKIQGGDVLVFRMEIVKIKGAKKPADKCDPATGQGCNDKQKAYVDKQGKATPEKRRAELKRLEGMQGGRDEAGEPHVADVPHQALGEDGQEG